MSNLKKIVIGLLILVLAIPATACGYVYFKLNSIHDSSVDEALLNNEDFKSEKGITNILLVGTDGVTENETSVRSDSMMILTVDTIHKSLKLTSLARDSYVDIPGHSTEKLTHAYAYGGINLLIETIENNFELDIQNYVTVNFFSFMDIIDAVGGVTVDVKSSELSELKYFTEEAYNINTNKNKGNLEYITSAGTHTLNGYQALAYARIRKNDTALERDRRQRDLIQGVIDKVETLPISKYPSLIETVLPYVKTNMKPSGILSLGTSILSIGNLNIKGMEFPIDDEIHSTGGILDGKGWVLQYTPESLDILHDFIFNDVSYE